MKRYLILMVALPCLVFCESPDTTLFKMHKMWNAITHASNCYNVDKILLAAIIYVERTENYDWKDEALDVILAKNNMNSSLGFCQIKLKTAYWIETQLNDSASIHFPGIEYYNLLKFRS